MEMLLWMVARFFAWGHLVFGNIGVAGTAFLAMWEGAEQKCNHITGPRKHTWTIGCASRYISYNRTDRIPTRRTWLFLGNAK
jgi:hypothetical protein